MQLDDFRRFASIFYVILLLLLSLLLLLPDYLLLLGLVRSAPTSARGPYDLTCDELRAEPLSPSAP